MQKSKFRKGLVLTVIVLFVGAGVVSSNVSLKEDKNVLLLDNQDDGVILTSWWDLNWSYRKQITINHTKVDDNLTNFPVLVNVTDTDLASKAQEDGDDLVFTDYYDSKIHHEIEYFNGTTGELVCWVNLTSLSSTVNTTIWMYYGNSGCNNQENVEGVWDANYMMVQHLNETSGTHYDSTSYGNNGTCYGGMNQNAVGMVDGADDFYGTNGYVDILDSSGFEYDSMTISAWVKKDSQPGNGERIIVGKHSGSKAGWFLEDFRTEGWGFYVGHSSPVRITAGETYGTSIFFHVVGVYDNGDMKLYVDGSLKASGTVSGMAHTSANVNIGRVYVGSYFDGTIDEVRISNNARNASWINTSYHNQNEPETFISVGGEEPHNYPPIASFTYTPTNPIQTDIIQFNDTSIDPDGNITTWLWDFGDGNTSLLQNPTHTYGDWGNYTVTLNVTDDFGATNETSQLIFVANSVPIANFTYSPPNPIKNETIYFTDTSTDIDGTIVSWFWDFDDGYSSTLQNPTHQYSEDGSYNVTLTVTDDDGASDTIMKTIVVYTLPNNPPYVPGNPIPEDNATDVPIVNLTLIWSGGDPDVGDILQYDVYFGDTPNPPLFIGILGVPYNQTPIEFELYIHYELEYDTTYFWKIKTWDNHGASTEGPIWEFTTEGEPEPDLDCVGSLSWTDVSPGATVTGSFRVRNIGDSGSLLDWEIDDYPDWGIWTFTPSSGDDLTPEDGPVIVGVTVIAPNQQNEEFTGEVKIVNKESSSDSCTIDVSLATPVNQPSLHSQHFNIHSINKRFVLLKYILREVERI